MWGEQPEMPEKQKGQMLSLFGEALAGIVFIVAALLLIYLFWLKPTAAWGATSSLKMKLRQDYSGIKFPTKYKKNVLVKTPITLEMQLPTRRLKITLKQPTSATLNFLVHLTPLSFQSITDTLQAKSYEPHLASHERARLVRPGKKSAPIDILVISIDRGSVDWITKYRRVIEDNFKTCKTVPTTDGGTTQICRPLRIEAKITRLERSQLTPNLPPNHIFPHLDYLDIFVNIRSVTIPEN